MYLYVLGAFDYNDDLLAVKIGVSGDVRSRIDSLQTGQFCEIKLLIAWETESRMKCFSVEKALHAHYAHRRMRGEWFRKMVAWDIVHVAGEIIGSLPCQIHGVPSCLGELRDFREQKRERNRRRKAAKKERAELAVISAPQVESN